MIELLIFTKEFDYENVNDLDFIPFRNFSECLNSTNE